MTRIFMILAVLLWANLAQAASPFQISDIRVEGLQRISAGTVFNYLPLEVGDTLDEAGVGRAMQALFKTGFFEDIAFDREGNILVITVEERPAISEIRIDGNKDIKTEDLLQALSDFGLSEGDVFQRRTLDRVQQSLTREYYNRGKYNVLVEARPRQLQRNRVEVEIDITEGEAATIKHINIVGNTIFTDEEILEDFESSTGGWLSWYTRDNQYSQEKLQGDLEALTSYYQDRGYIDFNIESTQVSISPDKKDIYVTANVREGSVHTVSEVLLTGDMVLTEQDLRRFIVIQDGSVFSRRLLEASVENITNRLASVGYAFANVSPIPEIDADNREVKITLLVAPGKRVYVRRINFYGNSKTKDEVMRREMRQFEGGVFSQPMVDRSRLRLQRLSFVESVDIETPRVGEDLVDVNVTIKERTAGSFTFGLGFSQTTGILGSLSINQENFLGSGKQAGISLQNSSFYQRFDLSFVNPYYTEDGVSRGFNFSIRELDQGEANIASYLADTKAFGVTYGIPLTEVDRVRLLIGLEDTEITPFSGLGTEITDELLFYELSEPCEPFEDAGCPFNGFRTVDSAQTLRTELLWSRDSRNRFFSPTRGSVQRLGFELAVPGSTIEYYKINYSNKKYFPLTRTGSFTFALSGEIGYGDTYGDDSDSPYGLPFFEHFFAGGVRSVRGYEDNTLGPRERFIDIDPDTGEERVTIGRPLGGDLKVTGAAELFFPIPFAKEASVTTRLSWFVDFGQVYRDLDSFEAEEIRYTTGLSLQWQAPVGPVIINLVAPLNDKDGDETETLQFAFGNFF
ncbi:MAG: outer membrane protein assembly factor BamA [Xanthomonadales bacterium]|nr:outer membrane protein assembly factor BamA [Xanthomonadales bacterium]